MLIKDLPVEIQEHLKKPEITNLSSYKEKADTLIELFSWSESIEGFSFWDKIYDGIYEEFFKKYPLQNSKKMKL